jgi:hypothetical protein
MGGGVATLVKEVEVDGTVKVELKTDKIRS